MAQKLGIAPSTVGLHAVSILRRTESKNMTEAVAKWSTKKGLNK